MPSSTISRPLYGGRGLKSKTKFVNYNQPVSPSIRRAWIEIADMKLNECRKESPSIRRAWIEILYSIFLVEKVYVALYTEGVD